MSGGTCVLSGLVSRVAWMAPGERPCLNCLLPVRESWAEWVRYYSYEDGGPKTPAPEVARVEEQLRLEGGHPSTYPTACIGSNLMMALALSYLLDTDRVLEVRAGGVQHHHGNGADRHGRDHPDSRRGNPSPLHAQAGWP